MRAALYGRFSTALQREESIADQFRLCGRLAERHGFEVVARFSDKAISGGTTQRPGYQELLAAARRGEFEIIVAEDTSRLWRNMSEQAQRLAELSDLGVAVVTHDLDTRQDSADIMGAVTGAMSAQYRKEIARRTRRGLEGIARDGRSAGGKAFGYVSQTDSPTGQREVHPEQAAIVRQIFEWYAASWPPRRIAAELNERGVPSPGAGWNRVNRRTGKWLCSAIAGDRRKGVGVLNNDAYRGVIIWNRCRWLRSAVDSMQRRQVVNPRSEWIERKDERLRIVSDELWNAVKVRQEGRTLEVGEKVARGIALDRAKNPGGKAKHLFSTLIECGTCGANYVMTDKKFYGCSSFKHGGPAACSNDFRVKREILEPGLAEGIQRVLLSPEGIDEFRRRVVKRLADMRRKPSESKFRVADLEREVGNLADAIASGALKASPALGARLAAAEAELEKLRATEAPAEASKVDRLIPRVADDYREMVANLPKAVKQDVDRARASIRQFLGGKIRVEVDEQEARFITEKGRTEAAFLRAVGGSFDRQTAMVAGERTFTDRLSLAA